MSCTALPVTVREISLAKHLAIELSWMLGMPASALEIAR